jgi:hypothetical protein
MSTEFALDADPPLMYDEFLADLPEGIHIVWRSNSGTPISPNRVRIYKPPMDHVDLRDRCDNDLVARRASEHDVAHRKGIVLGEAIFEQWGMGGRIEHFNELFIVAYGQELYDIVTTLVASDPYHGGPCKRCRPKAKE